MPHKGNPVAAVEVGACVRGLQAQVAVLNGALLAEHERAAGAWQAEWPALSEAFRLAGGAVGGMRQALAGLRVDERRMRANLELAGGLVLSEAVLTALAGRVGRRRAQELVRDAAGRAAARGRPLREELLADAEVAARLGPEGIDAALDPARSLGAAQALIDRALALHRERSSDP
jgi:3-carboxy-cis,cis-muconate cycloisomerase